MARRIGKAIGVAVGLAVGVPITILMVASRPHFNIQSPDKTIVWFAFILILLTVLPYICSLFFGEMAGVLSQSLRKARKTSDPPQVVVAADGATKERKR